MDFNQNLKVALLISTKDRPDFMIRQLVYYINVNSPHPVYIADSSNDKNAEILKNAVNKLRNKLPVTYTWYPPGPDNTGALAEQAKERYACYVSDDDYQIPVSLLKCAEFLENNPDYGSASGRSVSFRLKETGPYGKLQRLADYPRCSIESETARQRLIDFTQAIYSIMFFVHRMNILKEVLKPEVPMTGTMNELVHGELCVIAGKSKVVDCLSLVRQIHKNQYPIPFSFEWITSKEFSGNYSFFKDTIAKALAKKDNTDIQNAEETAKEIFWYYIQKMLSSDYKYYIAGKYPSGNTSGKNLRTEIGRLFPVLKKIYRSYVRQLLGKDLQLHYEVLQPDSKYYKDFKPVTDSFTGSAPKNL